VSAHLLDEFAARVEADARNRRFARRSGDPERAWAAEEGRLRGSVDLGFARAGASALTSVFARLRRSPQASASPLAGVTSPPS
jgi:hypothetical protein